jgi:hypothetical protein
MLEQREGIVANDGLLRFIGGQVEAMVRGFLFRLDFF